DVDNDSAFFYHLSGDKPRLTYRDKENIPSPGKGSEVFRELVAYRNSSVCLREHHTQRRACDPACAYYYGMLAFEFNVIAAQQFHNAKWRSRHKQRSF